MSWWCLGCGRRMGSPVCKKKCREAVDSEGRQRGNIGAERWPRLDGFMTFEVGPDRPEADDLAAREAWFNAKREKERARWMSSA